ncbi:alpha/beta hydrolase family protein [Runella zeae]|uniref:alpha/beta hydrolase family protein n=1 Tax=Runella zeae TaxID=94255 RepID=UPI0004920B25|nr:prolyl oligopeptidase family serine peptidase [Runella zeae]
MKNNSFIYLLLPLIFFVWSCEETVETTTPIQPKHLVTVSLVKEYSRADFLNTLGQNAQFISALVRGGVRQYKIVYKTKNTEGTDILASGAMTVPVGITDKVPLLSYQHGTIFNDRDAPSYFSETGGEGQTATLIASMGYIVSAPDYIGYGETKNIPHTYEQREGLATASLDMLRAVKEAIAQEKLNWNESTYIAGYSEGGFASMSLLKKLEETAASEFTVKAASCGAGAYNKTLSFKTMVNTPTSGIATHNASYIWVLLTYDNIYKLNRPISAYFVEPHASQIEKERQNARITGNLGDLLNPTFKKGISDGTDTALLAAVADNDVFDWKPKTTLRLYHGDKDDYVPYFNSQTAVDAMKKRGVDVELKTIVGGDHATSISEFLLGSLQFFQEKR